MFCLYPRVRTTQTLTLRAVAVAVNGRYRITRPVNDNRMAIRKTMDFKEIPILGLQR